MELLGGEKTRKEDPPGEVWSTAEVNSSAVDLSHREVVRVGLMREPVVSLRWVLLLVVTER